MTDERRAPNTNPLFHLVAALVFAGALVAACIASAIVGFGTSYTDAMALGAKRRELRLELGVIGGGLTIVPLVVGCLGRRRRIVGATAWLAIAAAVAAFAAWRAATAEPSYWNF